jgi:hypothetical protein
LGILRFGKQKDALRESRKIKDILRPGNEEALKSLINHSMAKAREALQSSHNHGIIRLLLP